MNNKAGTNNNKRQPLAPWSVGLSQWVALEMIFLVGPGFFLYFRLIGEVGRNYERAAILGLSIWLPLCLLAVFTGRVLASKNPPRRKAELLEKWVEESEDDAEREKRRRIVSSKSVDEAFAISGLTASPAFLWSKPGTKINPDGTPMDGLTQEERALRWESEHRYNTNGLPMVGACDISGNPYGESGRRDE